MHSANAPDALKCEPQAPCRAAFTATLGGQLEQRTTRTLFRSGKQLERAGAGGINAHSTGFEL